MMNIVGTLLMSFSLFIVSRGYLGQIKGITKWATATVIQSLGWIILSVLRDKVPEIISVVFGNGLILLSLGLYFNILAEFNNQKIRRGWIYLLVGLEACLLTYFVLINPHVSARIAIISGLSSLLMLSSSYILLFKSQNRPPSNLLTAAMFIICGTIFAARCFYSLFVAPDPAQLPFGAYPMQNISYLTFYITSIMLTFGFVLMCNDRYINDRKLLEDALAESEEKFRKLLETAPDAMVIVDSIGKIKLVNLQTEKLFGYTKDELIGKEVELLIPSHHIKGHRSHSDHFFAHPQTRTMGVGLNLRGKHKNGIEIPVEISLSPLKTADGIWVSAAIRDISERKKAEDALKASEEKFSLLAKNSTDIVSLHDLNFNYIYVSDSVKRTLGFEPEELIGKSALDFIHPKDLEYVKQRYSDMFNRTSIEYSQFRNKKKDGSYCWMESAGNFTFDKDGVISGLTLNTRDISERKQIEEQLIIAKKLAEELAGAKDLFLSNMSHEIRTPLNGIIGFTNLLLQSDIPPKQKKQVEIIKTSGNILMVLINDILDLAKINEGKIELEESIFNLSELINDILISFELRIDEKDLKMFSKYDNNIPNILIGDPIRISQILINLINNSKKFTNNGGQINLNVILLEEDHEKAIIEFSITDTGIGIAKEKLETIFEPFVQADNGPHYKYEGTGLGLSIVRRLVGLMNGSISINSEVNKGSTISFTIPLKKTTAIEVSTKKDVPLLADDLTKIGHVKVLIADDNEINQLLAQTILLKFGFEVDSAENGQIAIELCNKKLYDIILMDLKMPEMDGFEAANYIRTQMLPPKATIPIIAITADVTKADLETFKEAGINDFILKPFDQTDLLNKIISLVKKT
ncbi:MAG: PAS domain S-box protein [Bacteroidota bacterium]